MSDSEESVPAETGPAREGELVVMWQDYLKARGEASGALSDLELDDVPNAWRYAPPEPVVRAEEEEAKWAIIRGKVAVAEELLELYEERLRQ